VTPARDSHGQPDVARRADGYGIPGVVVDGQELDAVLEATRTAVARARAGEGPTLIEAKTYRFDEHCVGLFINGGYRTQDEVQFFIAERDPLQLFRQVMLDRGHGEDDINAIEAQARALVTEAVQFAKDSPYPAPEEAFELVHATPLATPIRR